MSRLLLIDADYIAFKAAASQEIASPWSTEDGLYWTWHCNIGRCQNRLLA